MYLMLKDEKVLYFDLNEFTVVELNKNLVPMCMRGAILNDSSKESLLHNTQMLKEYLSRRVLSLSRDNAKLIYTMFKIPQSNTLDARVDLCVKCKGVSIQDSYWVKGDNSNERFCDVNIRHKEFKEIVDVSLIGLNPTVTASYNCPDLTTQGVFRKAWVRKDNRLFLLKSDRHESNINTKMEVLASKILDCFINKIDHVGYTGRYRNTKLGRIYVDRCENFVDDDYSFVEMWEAFEYARRIGMPYEKVLGYSEEASSIGVLDFILSNTDRHTQNYGYLMSNVSGELVCLAPLFDFNCALVSDVFNIDASDTLSQMFNDERTLRQIADYYRPYSRVTLDRYKFMSLKQHNKEFSSVFDRVLERCRYIGII